MSGDGGQAWLKCAHCPDGFVRPEDVSAEIVRYLLESVQNMYGGDKVERCVISVPAYFDEVQRDATIAAVMVCIVMDGFDNCDGCRFIQWLGEGAIDT